MKSSVLLVSNFLYSLSGSRGACEELASRLAVGGHSVVTTSASRGRLSRLIDMVITCWRQRHRYEVAQVDVYSGLAFIWAEVTCWILRRAGKPYVLVLRGGNLPQFSQRWPDRVRNLLCSAAVVITPSNYLRDMLRAYRDDVRVLPNALDLNNYTFRLRICPQPNLVWIRAFHGIYNPSLASEVISLLTADFPEVHLTMIGQDKGDGSLQSTQKLADKFGVTKHIVMHRAVPKPEVPVWLNVGDIFLNTTNVDNTPVSVLEAMACGLCVVSTNVGGIPYLLEEGKDALLVPPNDPSAMAEAVRRILTEPGLARYLSKNAREKAEQFDWSKVLPQWEALFGWAAEKARE